MAKLIVKKECLDSEVQYELNGVNCKVKLIEATPEQLKQIDSLGIEVFDKTVDKAVK